MSKKIVGNCDLCTAEFTSACGYNYHINNKVCEKKAIKKLTAHVCDTCEEPFSSDQCLNNHMKLNSCVKKCADNIYKLTEVPVEFLQERFDQDTIYNAIHKHPNNPIVCLVKHFLCNYNNPQYNNIYISSVDNNIIQISNGISFVNIDKNGAIKQLIDYYTMIICNHRDNILCDKYLSELYFIQRKIENNRIICIILFIE